MTGPGRIYRHRFVVGAFVMLGVSLGWPAWAQSSSRGARPARSTTADQEAARLYDVGAKAARAGQWEKAREAFQDALDRKYHPMTVMRLSHAELRTGRYVKAAKRLTRLLRDEPDLAPEHRQVAEEMLAEAKAEIGTIAFKLPVDGAEVRLDGVKLGTSPLPEPVFVEPGRHRVQATKAGWQAAEQEIDVNAGAALEVTLKLAVKPKPKLIRKRIPLPPAAEPLPQWPFIAGIGVSGALAVVGVGTAVGSALKASEAREKFPYRCKPYEACKAQYEDLEKQRALLANAAVWSFAGAGIVGLGTTIYAFARDEPDASATPRAAIVVTPGGGGLVWTGRW